MSSFPGDVRRSSVSQVAAFNVEAPPGPFHTGKPTAAPDGLQLVRAWQWAAVRALLLLALLAVVGLVIAVALVSRSGGGSPAGAASAPVVSASTNGTTPSACVDFDQLVCRPFNAQYPQLLQQLSLSLAMLQPASQQLLQVNASSHTLTVAATSAH